MLEPNRGPPMADRTLRALTAADTEPLTLDEAEAEWHRLTVEARAAYLDLLGEIGHLGRELYSGRPVNRIRALGMRADARRARDAAFTLADRLERAEQLFHRKEPS